ncbi:MAG: hypothetical protein JSU65_09435 [Candidatus Zixiibacteriota bacterium]|nr:MAG: hypothetical protein JSU65_09435 [candidate division Zixibacteria bacterium]
MEENRFVTAGWVSVAAACVYPLAFVAMGMQEWAFDEGLTDQRLGLGPSDLLFLLFAALSIYAFWSLKRLMYERYSFRKIGTIIWVSIFWHLVYFGGSFLVELLYAAVGLSDDSVAILLLTGLWASGIVVFGIIDIIIGLVLLSRAKQFHTAVKVFGWLSLVIGVFEATLLLAIVAFFLIPLSYVALAVVFLSRPDTVEYV